MFKSSVWVTIVFRQEEFTESTDGLIVSRLQWDL